MATTTANIPKEDRVIILGAAGRDFHDFMTYWSVKPNTIVVCFTQTQIPGIEEGRHFPAEMCNNDLNDNLYPNGVPMYSQDQLEELIVSFNANICTLAYSDLPYARVQSLASRVNAAGCQFVQLPPSLTQLSLSSRPGPTAPIVAIVASRTGVGKSQTTRYVAQYYKNLPDGQNKVAAVRHPMPYDKDLLSQRCQRYTTMDDLEKYRCTIEEREEYYRHIEEGNLLFAGVDYGMILEHAVDEDHSDVVLWDGGNNDVSFYKPELTITLVDSLRPEHELTYYPGETNLRLADAVLITKTNELKDIQQAKDYADHLYDTNLISRDVPVFFGRSKIVPEISGMSSSEAESEATKLINGKRILVIDDGPTLTHGGLCVGAGYALAAQFQPGTVVDPKPFAQGSIKSTFEKYRHLDGRVLPAMGYGPDQCRDLQSTIQRAVDAGVDAIVIGTPMDLTQVIDLPSGIPYIVARYDLELVPEHKDAFDRMLASVFVKKTDHHDDGDKKHRMVHQ